MYVYCQSAVTSIVHVFVFVCVCSGYVANGMPPGDYVDAAMMTSRPMTSLPAGVGGAKCQQPMGVQFSQQVRAVDDRIFYVGLCIHQCVDQLCYGAWHKMLVMYLRVLCGILVWSE